MLSKEKPGADGAINNPQTWELEVIRPRVRASLGYTVNLDQPGLHEFLSEKKIKQTPKPTETKIIKNDGQVLWFLLYYVNSVTFFIPIYLKRLLLKLSSAYWLQIHGAE